MNYRSQASMQNKKPETRISRIVRMARIKAINSFHGIHGIRPFVSFMVNGFFRFVVALTILVLFPCLPLPAGDDGILVIRSQNIAAYNEAIDGFRDGCRNLDIPIGPILDLKGNVESGEKIVRGIKAKYPAPRLILSVGILATTIAREHFPFTPILFCMVVNHERFNLCGENTSGISSEATVEEQFLAFRDYIQGRRNIGVIFDPMGGSKGLVLAAEQVAQGAGFRLVKSEATFPNEVSAALTKIIDKIDALWIISDHIIMEKDSLDAILEITAKKRLPTFSGSAAVVKGGVLFAVSPDYRGIGLQAAKTAQTLLSMPSTASLGIQRPERFLLTVNSKTAKKLGINVSRFQTQPGVVLYP